MREARLLWGGQFVGGCGSALGTLALPLAIVTLLNATPFEAGALRAVEFGAVPAFALVAGAIVDRYDRRRLVLSAGILRTVALCAVPLALVSKDFGLTLVFVAAIVVGFASAIYDTAVTALLPSLFPRTLARANERLAMTGSMAEMFGNGLAGAIVQVVGAPLSLMANAAASLGSTLAVSRARPASSAPLVEPQAHLAPWAGLRLVFGHALLRRIVLANATSHFGGAMAQAVVFIFFYRQLHLSALLLGAIFAFANAGVLGALTSGRLAARIGVRATCALALVGRGIGNLCVPCAVLGAPLAAIVAARLVLTFCGPLFEVQQQNVQLEATQAELLGRAASSIRLVVWGALPFGSLAGGVAAGIIGIVPVLVVAALISGSSSLWMLSRPTRFHWRVTSEMFSSWSVGIKG